MKFHNFTKSPSPMFSGKHPNIKYWLSGWLLHPVSLSLFATLLIILLFPVNIPKYTFTLEEVNQSEEDRCIVWEDIDENGSSDQLIFANYVIGSVGMSISFKPDGIVKEWDIHGHQLVETYNNEFFITGRIYPSKPREICIFTYSRDSIFLNRISDLRGREAVYEQRFIAVCKELNAESDAVIINPRLIDMDNDQINELVFGINTGFALTPRAIFIYDFARDTIFRSIETGNSIWDYLITDMNDDGRKEIIPMGYAPGNLDKYKVKYHDSSNWVMVFNDTLGLEFPPVELPGHTGFIGAFNIFRGGTCEPYVLWGSPATNRHGLQLFRVSAGGTINLVREFTEFDKMELINYPIQYILPLDKDTLILMAKRNGEICQYNQSLDHHSTVKLGRNIKSMMTYDVDRDGRQEIVVFGIAPKSLIIYREGFTHPVSAEVDYTDHNKTTLSTVLKKGTKSSIYVSARRLHYNFNYQFNVYWYLKPFVWIGIWALIFLFTVAIRRIQKRQDQRRFDMEKKITELQLKIVRNQMDPHFTMNAINAVIDAINREEKEEARENLLHFSKMYRSLVLSADKIKRTLREELEFTENYLALERFRFNNRFSYEIEIDPLVDLSWEVPKMVIQSPVENAVKHGLLKKETGGKVVIRAFRDEGHLVLEISDNGIGRKVSSGQSEGSTGKGLQIMEQFFELYHKITGIEVSSSISDIDDPETGATGTRVTTMIQLKLQSGR